MAFLRECTRICDRCRKSTAVFELLTFRNERHGWYCRRCSGPALRELQKNEQKFFDYQASRRN